MSVTLYVLADLECDHCGREENGVRIRIRPTLEVSGEMDIVNHWTPACRGETEGWTVNGVRARCANDEKCTERRKGRWGY